MRLSPAQKLMQRRLAAVSAGAAPRALGGAQQAATSEARLQLSELGDCLRQLKQIQARDGKIARKRELIAKFDPWVAGILDAHRGGAPAVQDDIVLTMMVWALDIEDHDRALPLIGYVLDNDLSMPERYTRTAPTVIAEIAAETAIARIGRDETPSLDFLQLVEEATREKDMIDEVRAKLHKAIGLTLLRHAEPVEGDEDAEAADRAGGPKSAFAGAIHHFKLALQRHTKAGVKKDLEKAERELAKAQS
jgi:hypothetical protein